MNTNRLLNYLLVALVTGLVIVLGYKACQIKKDKAQMAQEQAELQKERRELGYLEEDTSGSQFSSEESGYSDPAPSSPSTQPKAGTTPKVTNDGIEYDNPKPVSTTPKSSTPKTGGSSTAPSTSLTTAKPVPTYSDGRYRVIAGSFTVMDGARRQMESLIKMGYHDAEIGRYNHGKYAVVIVKRTNNLNEANRILDQLERKGIDASVVDRERK